MSEKGLIIIISAPSGTGKGTVIKEVQKKHAGFLFSVSVTTRGKRDYEKEGVDYFFVDTETFKGMIDNGDLVEWVVYCDNYYGTLRKYVEDQRDSGYDIFLDIEVQGALNIKEKYPESVHIFMLPPSMAELERRIEGRGTESRPVIEKRIKKALSELQYIPRYDYVFFNDDVERSVDNVLTIICAEKMRQTRNKDILNKMKGDKEI
jgi:guanylate kinase